MGRRDKDCTRHWLLRAAARSKLTGIKSIKTRLLVGIGCVLFLTWFAAAVFTKVSIFDKSRAFLASQAASNAQMLLAVTTHQTLNVVELDTVEERALVLWRGDQQMFAQGGAFTKKLLPYKGKTGDRIDRIGADNWIIASRCEGQDCVVVAIRDTERKFAVRWLIATIYVPLFGILLLAMLGVFLVVKIGMRPLDNLTRDVDQLDLGKLERLPKLSRATELQPLANAIDSLSVNMSDQLKRERAFIDACAH